jgi:hypothetical protein
LKFGEFESLTAHDFCNVMHPLKRLRVYKNYVDVAFDSEYYVERSDEWDEKNHMFKVLSSTCVSVQFAVSGGAKAIYHPLKQSITWEELLDYTLDFFKKIGVNIPPTPSGKRHIYLIVFYGYAELSQISDFRDEKTEIQLYSNKAVSTRREVAKGEDVYVLNIVDLRGYFKTSLGELAKTVGLTKVDIQVDGKPHKYWITHMLELYQKHPKLFDEYALNDVEITVKVWDTLKRGLDPHSYRTLASLAMAEFRLSMKKLPVKAKRIEESFARKVVGSEDYEVRKRKRLIFDGDWNVRRYACLSYAGGNNQAFIRGYMKGLNAKFYDFVSLYITAGMIQPLPNEDTVWKKLSVEDVADYEGYCNVKFKFPETEEYPCLPIQLGVMNMLMFPLEGETWCTLSELRQAVNSNAKILDFSGYGFLPADSEINHELKPYFHKLLTAKNALKAEGGKGIEYAMVKSKLVDVVGKLMVRSKKYDVKKIGKFIKDMQSPQAFRDIAMYKLSREFYESKGAVGSTWTPEWASLILGNSRACVNEAIHHRRDVKCLFVSTDGGVWDSEPHFNTDPPPLLRKMMSVGGGLHAEGAGEGDVDELWIAGNRLYSTWHREKLVKFARMGSNIGEEDFENFLRRSFALGCQAEQSVKRMILTGMFLHDFKGVPINSELIQTISLQHVFDEDGKRVTLNRDVNIWRNCSLTKPYANIGEAFNNWYNVKPCGRPAGYGAKLSEADKTAIKSMPKSVKHRALAEKFGVSVPTIKRIRKSGQVISLTVEVK